MSEVDEIEKAVLATRAGALRAIEILREQRRRAEQYVLDLREATTPTMERIDHLCEVMHNAYEDAAQVHGWQTQARSRVPWPEVPEANKRTMQEAMLAVLTDIRSLP